MTRLLPLLLLVQADEGHQVWPETNYKLSDEQGTNMYRARNGNELQDGENRETLDDHLDTKTASESD